MTEVLNLAVIQSVAQDTLSGPKPTGPISRPPAETKGGTNYKVILQVKVMPYELIVGVLQPHPQSVLPSLPRLAGTPRTVAPTISCCLA